MKMQYGRWRAAGSVLALAFLFARPAVAIDPLSASPDITMTSGTGADVLADEDVGRLELGAGTSAALLGALPAGANLAGYTFLFGDEEELFVLDRASTLSGGLDVERRDVVRWDGSAHSIEFDGSAAGVPLGAAIDAVTVGAELLMSFDTTVSLPGPPVSSTADFDAFTPGAYTSLGLGAFTASTGGYAFAVIDAGGGNQVVGDATPTDVFGAGMAIARTDGGVFDVVSFEVLDRTNDPTLGTFGDPELRFVAGGVAHSEYTPSSSTPVLVVPSPPVEGVSSIGFSFRNFSTVDEFVIDNLILRIDGELVVADEDLVSWDGSEFTLAFDGSATGLDRALDVDAAHTLGTAGDYMAVSFDTGGEVGGVTFSDEDVLEYRNAAWHLAVDASAEDAGWRGADLDAVFVPEPVSTVLVGVGTLGLALLSGRKGRA